MTSNQTTTAVQFNFKPKHWRDNYKLEARLRADDTQKLIQRFLYRRPLLLVLVLPQNEVLFRLLLGTDLAWEMVQ